MADLLNYRVLRYDNATALPTANAAANGVLGQPNFQTGIKSPTPTAEGNAWIYGLAMDSSESLYVGDQDYNRVKIYKNAASKSNGAPADLVLGQPDFFSKTYALTQNSLPEPQGIAFDNEGGLFVTSIENRVVRFTKSSPRGQG